MWFYSSLKPDFSLAPIKRLKFKKRPHGFGAVVKKT